jgi:2-C-methyl-D-erythritol 4-phosphate cytidylyltransferase
MRPPARASEHPADFVGGHKQPLFRAAALVVAAGSGDRLGAGRPKAFVALAGRPMVAWSLDAIAAAGVPRAVVAVPPGHGAAAEEALAGAAGDFPLGFTLVEGGATRSASVRNALAAAGDVEAVAVHDAARPLAAAELFTAALDALEDADAAIAAARVTDTIKEAGPDGVVVRTHDRSRLWAIQTPQAFRAAMLRRALDVPDDVLAEATDDAWLVERAGGSVRVVEAPASNLKVTTPHDLLVAEQLLT